MRRPDYYHPCFTEEESKALRVKNHSPRATKSQRPEQSMPGSNPKSSDLIGILLWKQYRKVRSSFHSAQTAKFFK